MSAGDRGCPQQVIPEQASNSNRKRRGKGMMRKLQFWCSHEGDICCSISIHRFGDLNTWKF